MSAKNPVGNQSALDRLLKDAEQALEGIDLSEDQILEALAEADAEFLEQHRDAVHELLSVLTDASPNSEIVRELSRDATFSLTPIESDRFLTLAIEPAVGGGHHVTCCDIVGALRDMGITRGVIAKAIREAAERASRGEPVSGVTIVRARDPEPGSPIRYQLRARPSIQADLECCGFCQPVDRRLYCIEGDVILTRLPATAGRPGYNAIGHVIEPPPVADPPAVQAGDGVRRDGDQFIAEVSGMIEYDTASIRVHRAVVIHRDLTRHDALIDFDGRVEIHGSVLSGAHVRATEDVFIARGVEAAHVESVRGSVIVQRGIVGRGSGCVRAAKRIEAEFVEQAHLFAGDEIRINDGVLNAHLVAGIRLTLGVTKGRVVGGTTSAGHRIVAYAVGNEAGTGTQLQVGLTLRALQRMSELHAARYPVALRCEKISDVAERMQRAAGDVTRLPDHVKAKYLKLREACLVLERQLATIDKQIHALEAGDQAATDGVIEVHGQLHVNTTVRIGAHEHVIDRAMRACRVHVGPQSGRIQFDHV